MKLESISTALFALTLAGTTFAQPTNQAPAAAQTQTAVSPDLVNACVAAQQNVAALAAQLNLRLEQARQSNNPQEMRAALADLQAALVEIRTRSEQCSPLQAAAQPADPHAGHVMPEGSRKPVPPGTPVVNPGSTMVAPGAADPHAGHAIGTSPQPAAAPTTRKPAAGAADPHAGHATQAAPATKRAAPSKPPVKDPHAGHTTKEPPPQKPPAAGEPSPTEAIDPVCGLKVDRSSAPRTTHQGQTYYFCSEQHRQSFMKNPAKYLGKGSH